MTTKINTHHRRSIRLKHYDYSSPGAYFITICTHKWQFLYGEIIAGKMVLNANGEIAKHHWIEIPKRYKNIELDEYIIMPNHIHGIIIINDTNTNVGAIHELPLLLHELPQQNHELSQHQRRKMLLPKIIGRFKMNVGKKINQIRQTPGNPVWQRNYYEHIIRNETELNKIRQYIINNPLNWKEDDNYIP